MKCLIVDENLEEKREKQLKIFLEKKNKHDCTRVSCGHGIRIHTEGKVKVVAAWGIEFLLPFLASSYSSNRPGCKIAITRHGIEA